MCSCLDIFIYNTIIRACFIVFVFVFKFLIHSSISFSVIWEFKMSLSLSIKRLMISPSGSLKNVYKSFILISLFSFLFSRLFNIFQKCLGDLDFSFLIYFAYLYCVYEWKKHKFLFVLYTGSHQVCLWRSGWIFSMPFLCAVIIFSWYLTLASKPWPFVGFFVVLVLLLLLQELADSLKISENCEQNMFTSSLLAESEVCLA